MYFDKIAWGFLVLVYFTLTAYLFITSKKNKSRIRIGFISLAIGMWTLSVEILKLATSLSGVRFWSTTQFISATAIVYFLYLFSNGYIDAKQKFFRMQKVILSSLAIAIVLAFLFTDNILSGFSTAGETLIEKAPPGPWFSTWVTLYIFILLNYIMNLVISYRQAIGGVRLQIFYVFYGTIIGTGWTLLTGAILPAFDINQFIWLAPYGAIIFLAGITYVTYRYRLMEIDVVIKRTSFYLLLVAVITGVYVFILLLPHWFAGAAGEDGSVVMMVGTAVVIAITIKPLWNWLDNVTDRFFFQKKYDYYLVLEKVSRELNSVLRFEEVLSVVSSSLIREMHLKSVAIYLREKVGVGIYASYKREGDAPAMMPDKIDEGTPLMEYLSEKKAIIESGEFRHRFGHRYHAGNILDPEKAEIQRFMDQEFGGGLIIPMVLKKTLIGFMVLGEKRSQDLFTYRDLALLETLSSQMATALENIQLYEQMLNNERLTIIGTMSAGIAHEIRNPLASIKTFIQMLPEKYDRPEFRRRFNEIVPSEIERLSGITADLLAFSKPSSPSLESISVVQIIDRIISLLSSQIRKKRIMVERDLKHVPDFQADPQQIFQVFLNIILNGIQASQAEGLIRIQAEIKEHFQSEGHSRGEYVLISITDQGMGIKRKDFAYIFQPFFTTKSEGTGLGLATCKRIVEAHRGEILVESEEGRGTMFTVVLPLRLTPDVIKDV